MKKLKGILRKLSGLVQFLLLTIISCIVLAVVLMSIFDTLDYLRLTPLEKIVSVWGKENAQ